jgi:LmbE family N-acetylglucosaminyl deacetylase
LTKPNTLLAIFAHPDDESLVAGGALARYAAEGWRTALICATRGEWGPISDESLADYENLGEVRERELRAACDVLGVSWLRFLDLEDGSLSALDSEEEKATIEKIADAIRELRPRIIITFGPDGLYGHADHIAIGQFTTRACALANASPPSPQCPEEGLATDGAPELLHATAPRNLYPALIARLSEAGRETHLWGIPPEQFGVPPEEITTVYDITPFLDLKLAALRSHQTQLDNSHAFMNLTEEIASEFLGAEFFRRCDWAS